MKIKVPLPTFIKKITAKTNSRCSKSDSSDNEAEATEAAAAAAAGLYRESEKEELNSTHLPVVERDSQSPLKLNDDDDDDEFNNVKLEPSRSLPSRSLVLEGGITTTTGQCPFKHGTVYSGPYPGLLMEIPSEASVQTAVELR